MNTPPPNSGGKPLVDVEQLRSSCDGDAGLMREIVDLYFGQAREIMAGLDKAIKGGDVPEVDHLAHKLAGSSLACGMSALVPSLRQLEHNAKAGHLTGAPEHYATVCAQLEAVRAFMTDFLGQLPPN